MAEKKTEQAGPSESSSKGLTVKMNGQKLQLPMQFSTLAGMLAVGYQAFIGFHELQVEVERSSETASIIAGKLDDLKEDVSDLEDSFQAIKPEIEGLEKQHESDISKLEKRLYEIEKCLEIPERCEL